MFSLVFKDLIIHKSFTFVSFIYGMFITIISSYIKGFSDFGYILSIILITILSVNMTNYYDDKNNTEIILSSLPIQKSEIVIGKYLSLLTFFIVNTVILLVCLLCHNIFFFNDRITLIKLKDVLYSLYIVISIYSIYYPLLFKLGYLKMKIINFTLYILFLIIPRIITKLILKIYMYNSVTLILKKLVPIIKVLVSNYIFISLIFFLIMITSIMISIKVYYKREFY